MLLLFLVLVGQAGIPEGWMGMPVVALELTILGSFLAAGGPWLFQLLRLSSRPGFLSSGFSCKSVLQTSGRCNRNIAHAS